METSKTNNDKPVVNSDSEWIPCTPSTMPPEHNSMFAPYYGTEKWDKAMWRTTSDEVLVTVEFEDGARRVELSRTHDGVWKLGIIVMKMKVVAWKPKPEAYKG